jgi:hypothetical protein
MMPPDAQKHDASLKRAARLTEAKLVLKRTERHLTLFPYQSAQRALIVDLRLALQGLLEEVTQP